jgi:D-alanine--poly(phosphoribitol) ligase subunit 2
MTIDSDIHQRILNLIGHIANSSVDLSSNSQNLFESGILDSVAILSLVVELEAEFDVDIPLEDIRPETFDTLDNIVDFIMPLLEQ